jgi:hypothetical protein
VFRVHGHKRLGQLIPRHVRPKGPQRHQSVQRHLALRSFSPQHHGLLGEENVAWWGYGPVSRPCRHTREVEPAGLLCAVQQYRSHVQPVLLADASGPKWYPCPRPSPGSATFNRFLGPPGPMACGVSLHPRDHLVTGGRDDRLCAAEDVQLDDIRKEPPPQRINVESPPLVFVIWAVVLPTRQRRLHQASRLQVPSRVRSPLPFPGQQHPGLVDF